MGATQFTYDGKTYDIRLIDGVLCFRVADAFGKPFSPLRKAMDNPKRSQGMRDALAVAWASWGGK